MIRDTITETEALTTTITIVGRGTCTIAGDVAPISAKHGHSVFWHVNNDSDQICSVSIRNFRSDRGKATNDVARGLHDLEVGAGETRKITATANKEVEESVRYKYDIYLARGRNPKEGDWFEGKDPDYEIWP